MYDYEIELLEENHHTCMMCHNEVEATHVFVGKVDKYPDFFVYACKYHTDVLKEHAEKEMEQGYKFD